MNYPIGFPNRLKPAARLAVLKADRKFARPEQAGKRIRQAIFELCELACTATESGEWRADLALEGIEDFLHILCVDDPACPGTVVGPAFARFAEPIKNEIWSLEEWLGYVERLAEVGKSGTPSANPGHPTTPTTKDSIRKMLDEKGWSIGDWASAAGVSYNTAANYLEGKKGSYCMAYQPGGRGRSMPAMPSKTTTSRDLSRIPSRYPRV